MKKICLIIIYLSITTIGFAETLSDSLGFPFNDNQERNSQGETETLIGSDEFSATGFGGPFMSTTKINGNQSYFVGGRGAAIFNRTFILGGGGCGLVHPLSRPDLTGVDYQGDENYVHMGYGGVLVGFNLMQRNIINFSVTSLVGAGGVTYSDSYDDDDDDQQQDRHSDAEEFFVCEPTMMLHVNVTQWMRIGAGMSYRYTNGINTEDLSDSDFRNWSTVFAVDFGWF